MTREKRTIDFDAAECVSGTSRGAASRGCCTAATRSSTITLGEFEALLGWLASFPGSRWAIPSIGPSFGRAMDQARLLRRHAFRTAMVLPCADPRDAAGSRRASARSPTRRHPLILYLKSEDGFGSDKDAGLDAVGRLMRDGVAVAIKSPSSATTQGTTPISTACFTASIRRARGQRHRRTSGGGAYARFRPLWLHHRDQAASRPRCAASSSEAMRGEDWARAERVRGHFIPFEDLRDEWGPARVLHHGTELAGIAPTGPIPPFVSPTRRRRSHGSHQSPAPFVSQTHERSRA